MRPVHGCGVWLRSFFRRQPPRTASAQALPMQATSPPGRGDPGIRRQGGVEPPPGRRSVAAYGPGWLASHDGRDRADARGTALSALVSGQRPRPGPLCSFTTPSPRLIPPPLVACRPSCSPHPCAWPFRLFVPRPSHSQVFPRSAGTTAAYLPASSCRAGYFLPTPTLRRVFQRGRGTVSICCRAQASPPGRFLIRPASVPREPDRRPTRGRRHCGTCRSG